jgi:hypothetical protein
MENEKPKLITGPSEVEQMFQEIIKPRKRLNVLFHCEIKLSKCPLEKIAEFNKELHNLMIKYQISLIGNAGFFIEPPSETGLGANLK